MKKMSGCAAGGVVCRGEGGMGQKGEGCGKVRWGFNGRQEGWGERESRVKRVQDRREGWREVEEEVEEESNRLGLIVLASNVWHYF